MNNDNNLYKLYNLCWSNIYIRSIIIKHLKIYNQVDKYTKYNMFCNKLLKLFKYKSYIKELNYHSNSFQFNFENDDIDDSLFYNDLNLINNNQDRDSQQDFDTSLPCGIETLIIHSDDRINNTSFIPNSVTNLYFTSEFNETIQHGVIPNSVTHFSIETIGYSKLIKPGVIPNSVSSLVFSSNTFLNSGNGGEIYEDKLFDDSCISNEEDGRVLVEGSIPQSCIKLDMGNFNKDITTNLLPDNIIEICFYSFNSKIQKLPSNLRILEFHSEFNQDLLDGNGFSILPSKLECIKLGNDFNTEFINTNTLPSNLKSIDFGDSYDKPIHKDILPVTLESIKFGHFFKQSIEHISFISLPNLKHLQFYSTEYHLKTQPELISQLSSIIYNEIESEKQTTYYGI